MMRSLAPCIRNFPWACLTQTHRKEIHQAIVVLVAVAVAVPTAVIVIVIVIVAVAVAVAFAASVRPPSVLVVE